MAREFPKTLYHATKAPIRVNSQEEEAKIHVPFTSTGKASEWSPRYIHQAFPVLIYGVGGRTKRIENDEDLQIHLKEAEGTVWSKSPWPVVEEPELQASGKVAVDPSTFQKVQEIEFDLQLLKRKVEDAADRITTLEARCLSLAGANDNLRDLVISLKSLIPAEEVGTGKKAK